MNKIIFLILCLILAFGLLGCQKEISAQSGGDSPGEDSLEECYEECKYLCNGDPKEEECLTMCNNGCVCNQPNLPEDVYQRCLDRFE